MNGTTTIDVTTGRDVTRSPAPSFAAARPLAGRVATAALTAALALAISPWGIAHLTGRNGLSFRIALVSAVLATFVLMIAAAALATGRARRFMFHVVALGLPFALLAGLEAAAIAIHLADRIAPVEDRSVYPAAGSWPGHLQSQGRYDDAHGVRLYVPWRGDGIAINDLGLRTDAPRPKQPGEWRIAVTGGSTVWGAYVRDADTIPVRLAHALQARGYDRVTVYNFGIEGVELANEVELLRRFRDLYALDQVLFYTGGNDVIRTYYDRVPSANAWTGFISLELVKAAGRLATKLRPDGPTMDAAERAGVRRSNRLVTAMTGAAAYCAEQRLQCDVVLQPWLLSRAHPVGSETRLKPAVEANYPGLADVWDTIYAGALDARATDRTFDLRAGLDDVGSPIFADMIHVNEIGNAAIALRLVPIVARGLRHNAEAPGEQPR